MKRVRTVNGLRICQLTTRDLQYRPELGEDQFVVVDRDGEEVGVGVDSLYASMQFARCYGKEEFQ